VRPVEQTIPSLPNGDCLRACIASILEVGIDDLPNPISDRWATEWGEHLQARGLSWVEVSLINCGESWWHLSDEQYWIASVPSLNFPGKFHSVVMRGGELAHDPSLGKKYTSVDHAVIRDMTFLVPVSPN
jgi:hypothetical protein